MTTFTEVLPERKASKNSAVNWTPAGDNDVSQLAGVLTIHTARASVSYSVTEFPTGWRGRGFTLVKRDEGTDATAEAYSVFCSADGAHSDSCDCKGMSFARTCKHADAVRALVGNGWL